MTTEEFQARLEANHIPCDTRLIHQLMQYHEMLLDWNQRMDLTAVTEETEMVDRHYVDSLMALTFSELIPQEGKLIDVGTGAGLPGLPIALACPSLHVTLMDAQQKRLTFLQAVIDALHLSNVELIHARAEDGAKNPALRETYDIAVARAVAPMAVLSEYLLPFVRVGGRMLCWKGPALTDEWDAGRRAAFLLGGKAQDPVAYKIADRDWDHRLVIVSKEQKTPKQYPRKAGLPTKKPLGQ